MENACRAFIFNQDKILLCKQKNPPRNFWTLPGGSIEDGETLVDCISREITEELGIELEIGKMLYIRELVSTSRHRIEFYFSTYEPKGKNELNKIIPQNEIEEIRFFSFDELKTIVVKPDCLPKLINEIIDQHTSFPKYLGNVN